MSFLFQSFFADEQQTFKDNLAKRLDKEGLDPEELFAQIKLTKSCIAGSFPLQTYLEEKWEGSDLDIFTNELQMIRYFQQFYRLYNIKSKHTTYGSMLDSDDRYGQFEWVVEFRTPRGFRIQVILLPRRAIYNGKDIVNGTFDLFDFDFCCVAFDGEKLIFRNRKAVDKRKCDYDLNKKLTPKTRERLAKYEARGFKLTNRQGFMAVYDYKYPPQTPVEKEYTKPSVFSNSPDESEEVCNGDGSLKKGVLKRVNKETCGSPPIGDLDKE